MAPTAPTAAPKAAGPTGGPVNLAPELAANGSSSSSLTSLAGPGPESVPAANGATDAAAAAAAAAARASPPPPDASPPDAKAAAKLEAKAPDASPPDAKAAAKLEAKAAKAEAAEKAAAEKAEAEATYAASGGSLRTKRQPGMVKRSIALHLGYVGTAFKGLQVNRAAAPDSTVEEVLERVVYDAGLIAESNFGDLKKIKWTRNSRTDKGVHSVSTVVGLRVLLAGDERFDTEPEGMDIAADLNARLPPQVRVFSAQRVNKKFNARRFCFDRTYEYFLPAYLLLGPRGGDQAGSGGGGAAAAAAAGTQAAAAGRTVEAAAAAEVEAAALQAALGTLREALGSYVGTHPFHNYTAQRKTYTDTFKDKEARRAAREAVAAAATVTAGLSADEEEERMAEEEAAAAAAASATDPRDGPSAGEAAEGEEGDSEDPRRQSRPTRGSRAAKEDDEPLEEDDEEGSTEDAESLADDGLEFIGVPEPGTAPIAWMQSCRWLYEKSEDKRDRVTVRHFRTISSFTADEPAPLVPGGIPCVRLRVRGMSFMMHQIRHMIGGALAVARGSLPLPLLRASLAGPSRVTVPRAPPHTLILADCTFPPFRRASRMAGSEEATVSRWSGERLQLREGGQRNMTAFRRQMLDPALNELLLHPDWERFEECLPRFQWDPQAQEEVVRVHAVWEAARVERAKQKQEAAEAAAAAAATAAEAAAATAAAAVPAAAAAPAAEAAGDAPGLEAEAAAHVVAEAPVSASTVGAI